MTPFAEHDMRMRAYASIEKNMQSTCAACTISSVKVHIEIHDGIEMLLCNNFRDCNRRSGVIKI